MFLKGFCDSKYEITLNVVLEVGWPKRRLWVCQHRSSNIPFLLLPNHMGDHKTKLLKISTSGGTYNNVECMRRCFFHPRWCTAATSCAGCKVCVLYAN